MISVDAKKKELVGADKNAGREWQPAGQPVKVKVHDFIDPALGKANPYGVYDLAHNTGWVSVGTAHDIAATTTRTGLSVHAELDQNEYPTGVKITDKKMKELDTDRILNRHDWHGEWNYTLRPHDTPSK